MLYRENGQFKSTYRADLQMLPILQDRVFVAGLVAFAFIVVPLVKAFDLAGGGIENWFAYVLALVFLLFRPQGLFGDKIIERI